MAVKTADIYDIWTFCTAKNRKLPTLTSAVVSHGHCICHVLLLFDFLNFVILPKNFKFISKVILNFYKMSKFYTAF